MECFFILGSVLDCSNLNATFSKYLNSGFQRRLSKKYIYIKNKGLRHKSGITYHHWDSKKKRWSSWLTWLQENNNNSILDMSENVLQCQVQILLTSFLQTQKARTGLLCWFQLSHLILKFICLQESVTNIGIQGKENEKYISFRSYIIIVLLIFFYNMN